MAISLTNTRLSRFDHKVVKRLQDNAPQPDKGWVSVQLRIPDCCMRRQIRPGQKLKYNQTQDFRATALRSLLGSRCYRGRSDLLADRLRELAWH